MPGDPIKMSNRKEWSSRCTYHAFSSKNYNHNFDSRDSFIELRRGSDLDKLLVEYYNLHTTN